MFPRLLLPPSRLGTMVQRLPQFVQYVVQQTWVELYLVLFVPARPFCNVAHTGKLPTNKDILQYNSK